MGWDNTESLAGQVALVTGASRGIGSCIAVELARAGAAVVVNYLGSADAAARVVGEIGAAGGRAMAIQANIGVASEVHRLHAAAVKALGPIDILVNNASISSTVVQRFDVFLKTTPEEFDQMMRVNAGGAFFCSQAVLPSMIERRRGAIVTMASGAGVPGAPPRSRRLPTRRPRLPRSASRGPLPRMCRGTASVSTAWRLAGSTRPR